MVISEKLFRNTSNTACEISFIMDSLNSRKYVNKENQYLKLVKHFVTQKNKIVRA